MQLAVLGPMEVVSGSERLALGGPKQRLVLGLLAAAGRRTVTIDELVDGLWPEGPQAQPRKTVQVYITRLRRTFGADADAIRSEAAGYRLDTGALPVDADQFEADLEAITPELDDDAAVALLRSALERWRGDAFVDLRDCPAIVPMAVRLDELRLNAMHDLFEREVRRNPRAVLSELEHAVEANPLHEGFAAQLMTAQYRAGRQAEALATFQALRRRLVDELGLEPGPAVRELEGRILRHELAVAAPASPAVSQRQRRRVTVLSLELGVDVEAAAHAALDPEEELLLVAPARHAARAQILHGGGVVLAEAGDGLTACFGYPAREHSVEMAVRAGLAIRDLGAAVERADGRGITTRIGIDTGVVVVEAGGDGGSQELIGIAGEPLRSATKLRDLAQRDEVLVGIETASLVAGAIETEPTSRGTRATRVPPSAATDLPGLVDREAPLAEIAALASDAEHRVEVVVVNGPAGIGKSTVVDSFLAGLDSTWSIVRVRCDRRQSVIPLHPFRSVLGEGLDADHEPTERAVVKALSDRWSGRPVIAVEDVDAADPATLDVLGSLVDRLPNGLIVMTSRSREPLEVGGVPVPAVPIFPLDRTASRRLAVEIAGAGRLGLDVLNEIVERSGGVPLYISALTRAVLDREGTAAKPAAVPTSLYDSLMSALDRLGAARAAIQRCSVLGSAFSDADIELIGGPSVVARGHVALAVNHGVLVDEGGGRYRFASDLIAAVAYESLLRSERLELHAAVADRVPAERARAEPERLAYHLEAAGRAFEAAVAWRRASTKAITANRHAEAQQHARRAIQILDSLDAAAISDRGENLRRALVNLAVALQATSHGSAELVDVIERLRAAGIDDADPARGVVIGLIDVSNRQAVGDFDGAERVARATLGMADGRDAASAAFARQFLGATQVWRGRLDEGIAELETAAMFWTGAEMPGGAAARTFGALWSLLGLAAHFQDRGTEAAQLFGRARDTIPSDDGYGRCLVGATGATVDQLVGRTDVVLAKVEPLWTLAMDLSSDFWMRWAQMLLGWALAAERDEPAAASGLAMMAEVVDDESAARQAVPYFSYLLGSRLAESGRHDEAGARLESGLGVAAATGEQLWVPLLYVALARSAGESAGREEALAALDEASSRALTMGASWIVRTCRELREGELRD